MEKLKSQYGLFFLPVLGWFCWLIWQLPGKPVGDFANYYFSARLFLEGNLSPLVYEPNWFNNWIENQGFDQIFAAFSPFPPADALLVLPFSKLSLPNAKLAFTLVSALIFCIQLWRWFRLEEVPPATFFLVPLIFYRPIISNIDQGQAYFLVFSLVLEGYFFLRNGKKVGAILCWSLAFWLKIFPLVWLILLVPDFRRKTIIQVGLGLSGFLFLFVLWHGWDPWFFFLTHIIPAASEGLIIDRFATSFQSWNVFLAHIFLDEHVISVPNRPLMTLLFFLFKSLVTIFLFGFLLGIARREKPGPTSFFAAALGGILISPTGTYYALLPTMAVLPYLFGKDQNHSLLYQLFVLVLLALATFVSFHSHVHWPLFFRFGRLLILMALFIFLLRPTYFLGRNFLLLFLFFFPYYSVYQWFIFPIDPSESVETSIRSSLISDMYATQNGLCLVYRDASGRAMHKIPIREAVDSVSILVRGKAICRGGDTLVCSPDLKKKPILVGKTLYYLSEKNRGPGFFGLRKVAIQIEP